MLTARVLRQFISTIILTEDGATTVFAARQRAPMHDRTRRGMTVRTLFPPCAAAAGTRKFAVLATPVRRVMTPLRALRRR